MVSHILEVSGVKPIDTAVTFLQVCKRKGGQRAILHSNGGRIWQDDASDGSIDGICLGFENGNPELRS